jgi:exosortase A
MSSLPASLAGAGAARVSPHAKRAVGAVLLVLATVFLSCLPSADSLLRVWSDTARTTYTHGYIIAAIVVYLVWRTRDRLASLPWSPSLPASLLVAVLGFLWLVAVHGVIEVVHQLLMLALLWSSVWAIFGWRIAAQLLIPVGYLIFAIPVWDQVNFLLQEATVRAVALLLQISSIPAYVQGNLVHLAVGVFEVAGGCSGIHFFIVALALAVLYGEIGRDSARVRMQLVMLAGGLALLANWLRVYIIVVAGHLTNMQHSLIREGHYNFGWMMFAVMMAVFFLLGRRFAPAPAEQVPVASAIAGWRASASSLMALGFASFCVLAAPAWDFLRAPVPAALPPADSMLSTTLAGWEVARGFSSAWDPRFEGADRVSRLEFTNPVGLHVQLYVASYASQAPGHEMVGYGNSLVGPQDEIIAESAAAAPAVARELDVQSGGERSVIRFYYDVAGRRLTRGIAAQLWYGLTSVRHERLSSVVAMRTLCTADCESAKALLGEFATSLDAQGKNSR